MLIRFFYFIVTKMLTVSPLYPSLPPMKHTPSYKLKIIQTDSIFYQPFIEMEIILKRTRNRVKKPYHIDRNVFALYARRGVNIESAT